MLFVSPFDRQKVESGLTFPLSRTMETHFDGFRFNPKSPQAESMTPKAFWWLLWDSVMIVMSSANEVRWFSFGGGVGNFSLDCT